MMNPVEKAVEEASSEGKMSIVDFTGPWCTVCHRQDDVLEELVAETPGVSLHAFDVEEQPELAEIYDVLALPTLLLFSESGEMTWRSSGEIVSREDLDEVLAGSGGHG
ncbi:MAG: hypothetical protein MAG715_00729 [Methanonatronarchaeales archaeon]|nr:hypothetical protein [Methanonatronarchaeales archaeon]